MNQLIKRYLNVIGDERFELNRFANKLFGCFLAHLNNQMMTKNHQIESIQKDVSSLSELLLIKQFKPSSVKAKINEIFLKIEEQESPCTSFIPDSSIVNDNNWLRHKFPYDDNVQDDEIVFISHGGTFFYIINFFKSEEIGYYWDLQVNKCHQGILVWASRNLDTTDAIIHARYSFDRFLDLPAYFTAKIPALHLGSSGRFNEGLLSSQKISHVFDINIFVQNVYTGQWIYCDISDFRDDLQIRNCYKKAFNFNE